jgi:hypothetical protein
MRILDYVTPRALERNDGTTPVVSVLVRLALFLGVSVAVYFFIWLVVVYIVARLFRIPI